MKTNNLKITRLSLSKTQKEMAYQLNLAVRTLRSYELNECVPNVNTAIKIADFLGIKDDANFKTFKDLFITKAHGSK
jgi:DNA-binding XRE family transcriptional regulator